MMMQTVFCSFVHGMEVIANIYVENPNVNSNDEDANGNDNLSVSQEIEKGHILVQNYHYNDELLFNELLVLYSMYARNFSRRYMNNFLMNLDELEKYTTQYGINCCKQKLKVLELGRRAVELYEEIQKHSPSMLEGIKVPHYNSVISSEKFGFYKFEIEQLPKFEKMLQEFRERYKYLIESFQLYDDKLNSLQSHIDRCRKIESPKNVVHVIPISLEE